MPLLCVPLQISFTHSRFYSFFLSFLSLSPFRPLFSFLSSCSIRLALSFWLYFFHSLHIFFSYIFLRSDARTVLPLFSILQRSILMRSISIAWKNSGTTTPFGTSPIRFLSLNVMSCVIICTANFHLLFPKSPFPCYSHLSVFIPLSVLSVYSNSYGLAPDFYSNDDGLA